MKNVILTAAVLAAFGSAALAESHSVVRVATEAAYPPYNFINDAGEIDGFDREVGNEVCIRAELTCEWVANDWDSIIPNLVSGNYDVIVAGMSITDERKEVIDFSEQYTLPDPSAFMAMGDVDVTSGVIAAQAGTIQASYVTNLEGAVLLEFASPDETVAAVKNGEADAVLADKAYLVPIVETDAELSFVGDDVAIGGGIGMGVRQSDTELRDKLTAAIASMKADGTLNALITKWLPDSATF